MIIKKTGFIPVFFMIIFFEIAGPEQKIQFMFSVVFEFVSKGCHCNENAPLFVADRKLRS
jgi:hypothetical protein